MSKPLSQSPQSPTQTPGHLLAKQPDQIVNAMNHEDRENRLIAGAAVLLAVLIAGATAYWLNQDEPMVTSPVEPNLESTAQTQPANAQAATPLSGPEPAMAALSPASEMALPATAQPAPEMLQADVYFDVGRSGLRPEAKTMLTQQVEQVKEGEWVAHIQGYTDATGPVEFNKALGLRRADAVKRFLVTLGVPATAITVASLGPKDAVCADETAECRQRNRRVRVEFLKTGTPLAETSGIQGTSAEDVLQASASPEDASQSMGAADPSSSAPTLPQP